MTSVLEITHLSIPDFDEWGIDEYWSQAHWLAYLEALVKEYGEQQGALKFYEKWMSRSTWESAGDARMNWLETDAGFRSSLRQYKLPSGEVLLDSLYGGNPISGLTGGIFDFFGSTGNSITNAGAAAEQSTKTISWLLPVTLFAAVLIAAFLFFNYSKSILKSLK
jgi:hypothetical protein